MLNDFESFANLFNDFKKELEHDLVLKNSSVFSMGILFNKSSKEIELF
jgi:hypothetical protein